MCVLRKEVEFCDWQGLVISKLSPSLFKTNFCLNLVSVGQVNKTYPIVETGAPHLGLTTPTQ